MTGCKRHQLVLGYPDPQCRACREKYFSTPDHTCSRCGTTFRSLFPWLFARSPGATFVVLCDPCGDELRRENAA